jgi:hypothetical protein
MCEGHTVGGNEWHIRITCQELNINYCFVYATFAQPVHPAIATAVSAPRTVVRPDLSLECFCASTTISHSKLYLRHVLRTVHDFVRQIVHTRRIQHLDGKR